MYKNLAIYSLFEHFDDDKLLDKILNLSNLEQNTEKGGDKLNKVEGRVIRNIEIFSFKSITTNKNDNKFQQDNKTNTKTKMTRSIYIIQLLIIIIIKVRFSKI